MESAVTLLPEPLSPTRHESPARVESQGNAIHHTGCGRSRTKLKLKVVNLEQRHEKGQARAWAGAGPRQG
jgi:hypothetical protein